ncbi:MAG: TonB-dependent receptor, partial [Bacteroidota bacterium]|nr:TonB-dependent receptor [Bacteroidota bacterium]
EKNKLSLGISYVLKTRDYSENRFSFVSSGINYDGNPTNYFSPNNMNIVPGTGLDYLYVRDDTDIQNSYNAFQSVLGHYAMLDLFPTEFLRINTGVRVEATNMLLESDIIEEEELSIDLQENFRGSLDVIDVLPSLNMTYTLFEKELQTLNFRFSASQSVARPLFREKAPFSVFDFEIQEQQTGNTDLNRTKVLNIDQRLEFFPYLGEIISISGFYKRFTDPIEQVIISTASNTEITWKNVDRAELFGAELEIKKNLGFINDILDNINFAFNATYIKSKTSIAADELFEIRATDPDHEMTRPMFGQSPYIINSMISYVNSQKGLSINSGFNISGEKLVLVTPGGTPDVYDQPRGTLDMSINKTFGDKLTISLKGRNLLDPEYRQTYTLKDVEYDFQNFNIGRTFTLGFSYNFSKEEN